MSATASSGRRSPVAVYDTQSAPSGDELITSVVADTPTGSTRELTRVPARLVRAVYEYADQLEVGMLHDSSGAADRRCLCSTVRLGTS
jgi:hypothetical protein